MLYSWYDYGNGKFLVRRKKKKLVELEKVREIEQLDLALLVKFNTDRWSLYASATVEDNDKNSMIVDLVLVLENIAEYKISGDLFLYKKDDGWYGFCYKDAFLNINDKSVLSRRTNGFVKICDGNEEVISCRNYGKKMQHVIVTDKNQYAFYSYYDNINKWGAKDEVCVKHYLIKKIESCMTAIVKMYDKIDSKFYLGSLKFHEVRTKEEFDDVKYLGHDYYLVINECKQKVIYFAGIIAKDITDWVDEVTFVDMQKGNEKCEFYLRQDYRVGKIVACRDQVISSLLINE